RARLAVAGGLGAENLGGGLLLLKREPGALAAVHGERLVRGVLGEVLKGAVRPQHIGSSHAAEAAAVVVLRRGGRVVGGEVVKGRGNARLVEEVPEWYALAAQDGGAVGRLGDGGEGPALLMRVAVDEVKDTVRTGAGAVDEVGPGDGTLRRNTRAER